MGIHVEFNPDLALRNMREYRQGSRSLEECIPHHLHVGKTYPFLKQGQRNYWLQGECPLRETEGNQQLSRPVASIQILVAAHILRDQEVWTKGMYEVKAVFDVNDPTVYFEGYERR